MELTCISSPTPLVSGGHAVYMRHIKLPIACRLNFRSFYSNSGCSSSSPALIPFSALLSCMVWCVFDLVMLAAEPA